MSSSAIALPARPAWGLSKLSIPGAPLLPFLPFAAAVATGSSTSTVAQSMIIVELIFLAMAFRNPVWVLGAILVSELTIKNLFLDIGGAQVSTRLFITLASVLIVSPAFFRSPDVGKRAKPLFVAAIGFLAISTLANAVSADFAYVSQFFRYLVTGVIVLFLIPIVINSEERLLQVVMIAFVIGTASGLAAVLQHYSDRGAPLIAIAPNANVLDTYSSWGSRALGLTENPLYISNDLMLIFFPMLGVIFARALGRRGLQLVAVTAVVLIAGLYFSQTRSWVYSAALATVVMAFFLNGKVSRDLILLLIIGGGAFVFWTGRQGNRYSLSASEDDSAATRPVLWTAALNIAIDHPILGVGHNSFLDLSPEYADRIDRSLLERQGAGEALGTYTPHNDFLNVWLSFGTFGFIFYLAIIWFSAGNFIYAYKEFPDALLQGLSLGCLGALIATQSNAFFHNFFDSSISLWILAGFSIAMAALAAKSRNEPPTEVTA